MYTVLNSQGSVIARHLSATDAMAEILLHDGHDYDIRRADDGEGFELWITRYSRNSPAGGGEMVKSLIYSLNSNETMARDEIARKVIEARWPHYPEAITDASYDLMVAEISAQN